MHGTDSAKIAVINDNVYVRRIGKSTDPNINWSAIMLDNGIVGYVINDALIDITHVQSISLDKENVDMVVGKSIKLNSTVLPNNAEYKNVTWQSDNNDIAQVSQDGTVIAKKAGTTVISAVTSDGYKKDICTVNIKPEYDIKLSATEYVIEKGSYLDLNSAITYINADYTASTENKDIAIVDDKKIKGLAVGETNFTIKINDNVFKTAKIKVIEPGTKQEFKFDSTITVNSNLVSNIEPETKLVDFKKKINSNMTYTIKHADNILNNDEYIGTGTIIEVKNIKGETINTYQTVIYGDTNGDGKVDDIDITNIQRYIVKLPTKMTGVYLKAAITLKGESEPTDSDITNVQRYIVKLPNKLTQKPE